MAISLKPEHKQVSSPVSKGSKIVSLDQAFLEKQLTDSNAGNSGKPIVLEGKTAKGLDHALRLLNIECRFNERSHLPEFRILVPSNQVRLSKSWQPANDYMIDAIRECISDTFHYKTGTFDLSTRDYRTSPLHFGRETWARCLNALLNSRRVDPFMEWLEALPGWDGENRLDTVLQILFGAEPTRLNQWASRYLFLGAIQRCYMPGSKLDEVPVLIGNQGMGKSAYARNALPPNHPGWFSDGLHLAASSKERAEALQGRVIIECAEMAGSTRAELESLKSFLTRQDDGSVRLAYRRNPETMLRRCVIIGTSNDATPLPNDPTGNRRFVVVKLNKGSDIEKYMADNRGQLWVEALHRYRHGERANLPRELYQDQARLNNQARCKDELLEDQILKLAQEPEVQHGLTLSQIAVRVGLATFEPETARLNMRDTRRLSSALTAHGWIKERKRQDGGKQQYLWYPPACSGPGEADESSE